MYWKYAVTAILLSLFITLMNPLVAAERPGNPAGQGMIHGDVVSQMPGDLAPASQSSVKDSSSPQVTLVSNVDDSSVVISGGVVGTPPPPTCPFSAPYGIYPNCKTRCQAYPGASGCP